MPNLRCTGCTFEFELKEGKPMPKRCPYCAREGTLGRTKLMQEWIDDVEHASQSFINS